MAVFSKVEESVIKTSLDAYQLKKVGNSYGVILPREWVDAYGLELDGRKWVSLVVDANEVRVKGLDAAEVYRLIGGYDDEAI